MRNIKTYIVVFVSLLISILIMANTFSLPEIKPKDADIKSFSASRAMDIIKNIAQKPHQSGSEENKRVREALIEDLKNLGLTVELQETDVKNAGWVEKYTGKLTNILGVVKGSNDKSDAILLMAHYDSVSTGPGAADDSAGVATVLETVRALKEKGTFKNNIIVLLTDGEEHGLLGAEEFVKSNPYIKGIKLVVNLEARGNSGPAVMFETGKNNSNIINAYEKESKEKFANSGTVEIYKRTKNNTDFSAFKKSVNGLNFANVQGGETYHCMTDNIENYNQKTLQHYGENILGVMSYLGNADLDEINKSTSDNVYFNLSKNIFINYSEKLTIPFAVIITLLLVGLIAIVVKKAKAEPKKILMGFFLSILSLFAVYIIVQLLHNLSQVILYRVVDFNKFKSYAERSSYLLHISKYNMLLYIIAATGILAFMIKFCKKYINNIEFYIGVLIIWDIMMISMSVYLKGLSYLFTWPTLIFILTMGAMILFEKSKHISIIRYFSIFINIVISMSIYMFFLYLIYLGVDISMQPINMVLASLYGIVIILKVLEVNTYSKQVQTVKEQEQTISTEV